MKRGVERRLSLPRRLSPRPLVSPPEYACHLCGGRSRTSYGHPPAPRHRSRAYARRPLAQDCQRGVCLGQPPLRALRSAAGLPAARRRTGRSKLDVGDRQSALDGEHTPRYADSPTRERPCTKVVLLKDVARGRPRSLECTRPSLLHQQPRAPAMLPQAERGRATSRRRAPSCRRAGGRCRPAGRSSPLPSCRAAEEAARGMSAATRAWLRAAGAAASTGRPGTVAPSSRCTPSTTSTPPSLRLRGCGGRRCRA